MSALPALAMNEADLIKVLTNSLYPGAEPQSVMMVISYCQASGLDPMQKPVHIVPIWDGKSGKMRDVVMPGIGLYRTQAARSGEYAGVSEPEYGPDKTENIGGVQITFPEWCRVTVKRLLPSGQIVEFAAVERWKENYAAKGGKEKSIAPNAMWTKRPYGQIAKCAEAQALRKAFPEVGSAPTADEMEGKAFDEERDMGAADVVSRTATTADQQSQLPPYPEERFAENFPVWAGVIRDGKKTAENFINKIQTTNTLSEDQLAKLRGVKATEAGAEQ